MPPLQALPRPDGTVNIPPTALLVPLPTVMRTEPPRPTVPAPEPMLIKPLFPVLDDPELKDSHPLDAATPPFSVPIDIAPLLVPFP